MLTGRAAELRPDINYLAVHPIVLVSPEQARYDALNGPAPAENTETLRARGRQANLRRAKRISETNAGRDIPIGGRARRVAKAHRNAGLCMERSADGHCPQPVMIEPDRCPRHLRHEWTRTSGKQYEGDAVYEDTGWRMVAA